jgi:hypothetical protein
MKYVMLIFNTEAASQQTAEEYQAWSSEIFAWYEKQSAAGTMPDGGAQLQGPETARTVRAGGVTDGPFMETKEHLGGFYLIDVADLDTALDWAGKMPIMRYGTVEVRPVEEGQAWQAGLT